MYIYIEDTVYFFLFSNFFFMINSNHNTIYIKREFVELIHIIHINHKTSVCKCLNYCFLNKNYQIYDISLFR